MGNESSLLQSSDENIANMVKSITDNFSFIPRGTSGDDTLEDMEAGESMENNLSTLATLASSEIQRTFPRDTTAGKIINVLSAAAVAATEEVKKRSDKKRIARKKALFIRALETEEELRTYMQEHPEDYKEVYYELAGKRSVMWMRVFEEFTPLLDRLSLRIPPKNMFSFYPCILVRYDDEECFQYLLDLPGFDVNTKYGGVPLLHLACRRRKHRFIDILLERGADIYSKIEEDAEDKGLCRTLFDSAVVSDNVEILERIRALVKPSKEEVDIFPNMNTDVLLHLFSYDLLGSKCIRKLFDPEYCDIRDVHREYMHKNPETPEKFLRYCFSELLAITENPGKERYDILMCFYAKDSKNGPLPEKGHEEEVNEEELQFYRDAENMYHRLLDEYLYVEGEFIVDGPSGKTAVRLPARSSPCTIFSTYPPVASAE